MSTSGGRQANAAPTGPAGGDLGGNYPSPSVAGVQGRPASATAPNNGQSMVWNGAIWLPSNIVNTLNGRVGAVVIGAADVEATFGAKGQLLVGTGASAGALLAAGADTTVLTADSTQAGGVKWAPAAAGAMTLIASTPVASGSVTFSSIPQTFSHLLVTARLRSAVAANSDSAVLRLNGDSATSYFSNFIQGLGSTASGGGSSSNSFIAIPGVVGASLNANETSALEILIPNYTDTTAWRSLLFRCGFNDATNTNGMIVEGSGTYPSTVAVSSLLLAGAGGSLSSKGPVCLYGIS